MIRKKVLVCITMCIAMAYNNFCFNVSANVIENTEQLNASQNEENVDNKLEFYDDLNMSAGEILQKYNDDSSIDYHDIACSYEKEEKLLTFNKIAQIKDQLSSIELDVIKEYLFVYGTATNDRDIQKTYEYVISLLESNDERIISNSTNAIVNYAVNINATNPSYSSAKAVAYAHKYSDHYNPNYKKFASSGGDCCNFVSQCLKAGGFPMTKSWYYKNGSDYSSSWINCRYLLPYLKNTAYNYDYFKASYYRKHSRNITKSMKLNDGDVVFVCTSAGVYDLPYHALFVTSANDYEIRCASHTDDYYSKDIVTNEFISDNDYLYFIDIKKDPYTYK